MKKSFNIQERLHCKSKCHGTKPMHPSSSRAFQRHQEHNLKNPSLLVDLISTNKTNKQPSFIDRYIWMEKASQKTTTTSFTICNTFHCGTLPCWVSVSAHSDPHTTVTPWNGVRKPKTFRGGICEGARSESSCYGLAPLLLPSSCSCLVMSCLSFFFPTSLLILLSPDRSTLAAVVAAGNLRHTSWRMG